nr:hypothetical protein [Candidatus Freyarchaeota archaeon]
MERIKLHGELEAFAEALDHRLKNSATLNIWRITAVEVENTRISSKPFTS